LAIASDILLSCRLFWKRRQRAEIERLEPRMMFSFIASGAEALVNTNKSYAELNPVIASDGSGNYVVVWANNGQDGGGWGVYGQLFNASGTPVGSEFLINQTATGEQPDPSVAMNSSGTFVVSWTNSQNSSNIYAREFDSSGAALTNEFLVSTSTTGVQENSAAGIDSAGDIVVAWDGQGPGDTQGIFSQSYIYSSLLGTGLLANLTAEGVDEVNTTIDHEQYTPSIAVDQQGGYVVAWTDRSTNKIEARLGTAASGLSGSEFLAGTSGGTPEDHASVGIDSAGAFTVAWQENYSGVANWDILARQYNASGVAQEATPIAVNTYTKDAQTSPTLSMGSGGSFIIAWESANEDGDGEGVFAQAFTSAGAPAGGEFQVNTTTHGDQEDPAVNITGPKEVIAWDGNGIGDSQGIFQQLYVTDSAANVAPTITTPVAQSVPENGSLTLSSTGANAFAVADSDNDGGVEDVTLAATNGTLTLASGANVELTAGTGTDDTAETFVGTLTALNTALNGLVFTPASNFVGSAGIEISIDDLGNSGTGGALSTTSSLSIAVTPAPVIEAPTTATTTEDTPVSFSNAGGNPVTVGDPGNPTGTATITLTATNATLTLADTTGITFSVGAASGASSDTFTGTFSDLNTALDGLQFVPDTHYSGSAGLAASVSEGSNTASAAVAATVTPVAHTPTITTATTNENAQSSTGLVISPNTIDSTLSGYFEISVITGAQLFESDGVTPITDGQFITFAQGEAGLRFTPTSDSTASGAFDVQASTSSSAAGLGGAAVPASVTINPVPLLSAPANATTNEDSTLTFSNALGDPITVSDPGNSSGTASVTLAATDGTLTLANLSGITITSGSSTGSGAVTFTGPFSNLNAALDGLEFTPSSHYYGAANLAVSVTEGANTASGSVPVSITQLAHAPLVTNANTNENTQSTSGLVITPNSLDSTLTGFYEITGISGGSLFESDGVTLITDGQFITFAQGEAGLRFTPANDSITSGAFDVQASTSSNAAGLGGGGVPASVTIDPVPLLSAPTNATIDEDNVLTFSNSLGNPITVNDPGNSGGTASVTLVATEGTISLTSQPGVTITNGSASGSGSVTFTGTFADLNAALDGLEFTPSLHYYGSTGLAVSVTEGSNTAASSVAVNVLPVAHTPSITNATAVINDQTSGGLVVSLNPLDGSAVGYIQVTNISGGTLYQNDGTTVINSGDFITIAQAGAGLRFTPITYSLSDGTFDIQASTSNNAAGLGGSIVGATVSVIAPPANQVPGTLSTNEDTPMILGSSQLISVSDPSIGSGNDHVTLTASNGTVTLSAGSGVAVTTGTGTDDATVSFTGSLSQLNAALNGLLFTPATNYYGVASIQIATTDPASVGPNGPLSATSTFDIVVARTAHTPSITAAQTIETAPTTSGLVITPNALDTSLQGFFKITAITNGSLFQANGATPIVAGDFITFAQGEAGLVFAPDPGSAVTGSFTVQASTTADDTGLGGTQIAGTIAITRKPTVTVQSTPLSFTEGSSPQVISQTLTITEPNGRAVTGATVRLNGYVADQDALQFVDQNGITGSWDSVAGVLTLTGTASAATYETALQSVTYVNSSQDPSQNSRSAQFVVTDALLSSMSATRPIGVSAVNNAPTITSPLSQSTNEDVPLQFSPSGGNGITLGDVDSENNPEQLTLTATNGTLATSAAPNAPVTTLTLTAPLGSLNAALDGLIFTPSLHYWGTATITVNINDLGNTGLPGPRTSTTTLIINVAPVAHTPSVTDTDVEEGHRSNSGLVITPNSADQSLPGYYKITGITGGTLLQNDGVTPINNGDFITFAQGLAGLHFTPASGSVAPGAFIVQASVSASDAGLGGQTVEAIISVEAGPLVVQRATLELDNEAVVPITIASLYVVGSLGAAEEISYTIVSLPVHGTLLLNGAPLPVNASFTAQDVEGGALSYAPLNGVPLADSFQFQANDAVGRTTGTATFHIKPQPIPINPLSPPTPAPTEPIQNTPSDTGGITTLPDDSGSTQGSGSSTVPVPASAPGSTSPSPGTAARSQAKLPAGNPANVLQKGTAKNANPAVTPNAADAAASRAFHEAMRAEFVSSRTLLAQNSRLWVDLDAMKQNMHSEIKVWAGTASFVSIGMSLFYLMWIFRAGALVSSVLSSMPAWSFVDPLPILESMGSGRRRDDDDEGLESLVSGNRKK
jgi:hypothetical protein